MITTLEELKEKGEWHGLFYVPFIDVESFIVHMKLDFEERLSNAVNDAYDQGYVDGVNK